MKRWIVSKNSSLLVEGELSMVCFSGNGTRWQFSRPHAATDGAPHRDVCEFTIGINARKQEPATTHVASTHKLLREKKPFLED